MPPRHPCQRRSSGKQCDSKGPLWVGSRPSPRGGKRTLLAAWQLRPAPWAIVDYDHAVSTVMDHDPVGGCVGPEVDQAVGAIVAIRVLVTNGLHVGSHHFATVVHHAVNVSRSSECPQQAVGVLSACRRSARQSRQRVLAAWLDMARRARPSFRASSL